MCGFAGEFVFGGGQADVALARRMAERLRHRGPDEEGAYRSDDARFAVALRRLAVIDPPTSHQPITTPDGRLAVAFNGEIYNFAELRAELSAEGVSFATAGDTEVLLHLYRREGEAMLQRLVGMFAFVLYDREGGRLLLARDRLGQKPLWYAVLPGRVVFASEAKGLLGHPSVSRQADSGAITYYCTMGYIPAPLAAWPGVRKLPPATVMTAAEGPTEPRRYWSPPTVDLPQGRADLPERVRHSLERAVAQRMVADVPLGALLSGGVDSSIVVALMARAAGAAGGVRTFTAGFDESAFDERPAAAQVARHCGTDHTELLVRPAPAAMLDELVAMYDEPFGDSSALPTWLICREARRHVTVALAGDGGDEVFGGYDRYRAMHLAETMGWAKYLGVRVAAFVGSLVAPHDERSRLRRLVRFAEGLEHPFAVQYFMYRRLFGPRELPRLLTDDFLAEVDAAAPADWFCGLYEDCEAATELERAQRHDLATYLPDDLLVKADIASMAASLELRAPMLDHRVVALGLSLPAAAKVGGGRGKVILREAFADMLPAEVWRRPKRGFAVPLDRWLREDLLDVLKETLLGRSLRERGVFREEALAGLINDQVSGRGDHRHRLWALLVLARWLERWG
jgi:asparagine synthase (glutamine-hydrolysing)